MAVMRVCIVFDGWIYVYVDVDAKNRPIGNLSQWDDLLSDLKAAFRSWFIADDGWNELQKSGDSNSRKQIVQLSSLSISAGNLVFRLDKRDIYCWTQASLAFRGCNVYGLSKAALACRPRYHLLLANST